MNPSRWLAVALSNLFVWSSAAGDWPQWRGPWRTGHVPGGMVVPARLPLEPKAVWKLKIGEGLASPVVAGGRVYYFDNTGGKETLHAIDASTTREVWRKEIDGTFSDNQGPTGPRCTPLVDGDRVYAQSCKGELQCLNAADGRLLWRVNFTNDLGAIFIGEKGNIPGAARHGNNGPPVIDGEHLIVCAGGTNGAGVVCFEKHTGRIVWKSQNDMAAYAPPMVATIAGVKQVVGFTCDGVVGLQREDGALLWRIPVRTAYARHVTTPVIWEDRVVVSSHQAGLIGIKVSKAGPGLKAEECWISKEAAMNFSSPVAVGQYLYGLSPARNLICVEIPTGKLMWSRDGHFTTSADKAHAAFVVLGQHVLALTDGGQLVLFSAHPGEFTEISRVQVCAMNWCNPAYADGKLYLRDGVRGAGELLCVDLTP